MGVNVHSANGNNSSPHRSLSLSSWEQNGTQTEKREDALIGQSKGKRYCEVIGGRYHERHGINVESKAQRGKLNDSSPHS